MAFKEPKALQRMRKRFTFAQRLAWFRLLASREPESDAELEQYTEGLLIECYNEGRDEVGDPPTEKELAALNQNKAAVRSPNS